MIFNSFYLLHSYNPSILICLCFNMVSFRGQKNLGPRTFLFKISDDHSHPLICEVPPPPPPGLQYYAQNNVGIIYLSLV